MTVRLLLLGGTTEAAELARHAHARFGRRLTLVTSLAGRLVPSQSLPGDVRVGGFGGADGLARFLREEGFDLLIDATHPFAQRISGNAALATAAVGVPRLMLVRPPWAREPGDHWLEVDDFPAAAALLPAVATRVFLTTGPGEVSAFAGLTEIFFVVRLFTAPPDPLPLARYEVIVVRPPFTVEGDRRLIRDYGIGAVVTKQSGGPTETKLAAARIEGIPVVMIRRPALPEGEQVATVGDALAWLADRL